MATKKTTAAEPAEKKTRKKAEEVVKTTEEITTEIEPIVTETEETPVASEEEIPVEAEAEAIAGEDNKELSPDEIIARRTSRFTHELAKASKRVKKEMYSSEHVITEYGDEDIETESTILRKDYLELVASARSQKILEGRITGFRYANETRKSTILAEVEYGSGLFNVLIPSYLLYDYEMSKYVEPDKIQIIENNIKRRIGGVVKFIVRYVDEKERTAYGDRLMAQSIIGYENYIKETRDGKPRITSGMIVKSQVMYAVSKGIVVDALGTEIQIRKEDLSHSYVGDARDEYETGDYVNVKIDKIKEITVEKNETNYRLVQATGSVKEAKINNKARLFNQFKVDGIYAAEVTYVEEAGVFCRLRGGMDCLVALPRFGANPARGQKRMVKITEKDEERNYLYGIFISN